MQAAIDRLNATEGLDGYIVQLPLPDHLKKDTDKLLDRMISRRDVDGLMSFNRERLFNGDDGAFLPTPIYAVMNILASLYPEVKWDKQLQFLTNTLPELVPPKLVGKQATIISDGDVFGQTLKFVLEEGGMEAMVARSDALDLERKLRDSELVVTAVGHPGFLTGDMIAEGSIVIDVGTTLIEGKTKGDCHWESVSQKAFAATPVPGGVGPVTVAMLYANLLNLKLNS